MITGLDFEKISLIASRLYAGLEEDLVASIAERIAKVGYLNTVAYNSTVILEQMRLLIRGRNRVSS